MSYFRTERIHSLDSLRAIMMILGIVLHASTTYVVKDLSSWPLKDTASTSYVMDWILNFIHAFRMPIFFVVAGFFAALLFYERSSKRMLINRVKRILLPFVIFIIILWPLVMIGFKYSNNVFDGIENPMAAALSDFSVLSAFIPERTLHLWFLYYLVFFSITSYVLGLLFKKMTGVSNVINRVFGYIIQKPILKVMVYTAITFVLLLLINQTWVATSTSFILDFNTFIFYAYFYFFGWILFKSKTHLNTFLTYDWLYSILAIALLSLMFFLDTDLFATEVIMLINSLVVWLFIFGFTGLFIRYTSKHSSIMRYVSDSSYWVYLLHLPLTALIPGLLYGFGVSTFMKFTIVIIITTIICFVSYHYLVRSTFIGKFLNGRSYSRRISDIKLKEESIPKMEIASS